ncbi:MAG: hypothetical protein JO128_06185, partial [Alphaproteobacteria bacterium]|nr:hypothetical protein [Alphaproteobacteria bacterium]
MSFDIFDRDISLAQFILGFVLLERLIELWIARRNTERLLEGGAVEHGSEHYPFLIILHAGWLAALVYDTPPGTTVSMPWLAVYIVLQFARIWVIASLGRFWTTR